MKKILRAFAAAALFTLAAPAFAEAPAKPAPATTAPAKPAPAPAAATPAKPALLDINSASLADLQALKGVGDVRAKAIVAGRPYKGKDDLVQKKIIPQGVYDAIKDQIIAKQK
ncbi:helix-hairpin-helix domain-containing protein [Rhodoblastus sp.]|jgi:DNA uptake protein ComE-like DNA-binding protein|uniref:ComEA family DNA-binding protein n=1 Tax=Rhodoblastus sp. TaxID=1962975 RepID=UPI0025F29999|nr:helix-hairpin-helix domain-containing protein [Rhodoblastus sp.]